MDSAHLGGAHRSGDGNGFHCGLHPIHSLDIALQVRLAVEGQQGGYALGNGLGGHHLHGLVGQGVDMVGGRNDVLVIGQDDDLVRGHLLHSLEHVLGAGIHGLPSGNYSGHPQALEDLGEPVSGGHGHDADIGLRRLVSLQPEEVLVLLVHVADAHLVHGAQRGDMMDNLARIQGMDVNPDGGVVADHYQGLPLLLQLALQSFQVKLTSLEQELGAVAVRLFVLGHHLRRPAHQGSAAGDHIGLAGLELLGVTLEIVEDALQNGIKPLSAGIHHPGLLEDIEEIGGVGYRFVGGVDHSLHDRYHIPGAAGDMLAGGGGGVFGHGEDSPLHGVVYPLVGRGGRLLQGIGKLVAGEGLFPV